MMDPRRRLQHQIRLVVGYVLVGIALLLLTVILLFVAYGFGLQNGRVIQNGLLFLSSEPNPAQIYLDGSRYKSDTNSKLVLPEATYHVVLKRSGYRDWGRAITVTGGEVESYTYPLLFPLNLTTNTMHSYAAAPPFVSQSDDQHWLVVGTSPADPAAFDVYDLTDPKKAPLPIALPAGLLTATTGAQSLQPLAWADDNEHLLVKHEFNGQAEYILMNRSNPAQSLNLSKQLSLPGTAIDLRLSNDQYDHYMVLNTTTHVLSRATLSTPALQPYRSSVLAFATYQDATLLYVTPDSLEPTKVDMMVYDGTNAYLIRRAPASANYLLATANFDGDMYLAVAGGNENTAYLYRNPIGQLSNALLGVAVPAQVFSISKPNHVAFSNDGQYVLFENGSKLVTYDADNTQGFSFTVTDALDMPATHAQWLDGARLSYVSGGQTIVLDYDGQNRQVLVSADARYPLAVDDSDKYLYALVAAADKSHELLTSTSLRTQQDQ